MYIYIFFFSYKIKLPLIEKLRGYLMQWKKHFTFFTEKKKIIILQMLSFLWYSK